MNNLKCINAAVCIKDAYNVEQIVSTLTEDPYSMSMVEAALNPYISTYNVSKISMEDSSTNANRLQAIKETAKRILKAIMEFFKHMMRSIDKYQLKGEAILAACDQIELKIAGVSGLKKRSLFFSDERLKQSMYCSVGGSNVRNSVNKILTKAIDVIDSVDYKKFVHHLEKLEKADSQDIQELLNDILKDVNSTAVKNLQSGSIPPILSSLEDGKDVTIYFSGPHPGEKYIYCKVPNSVQAIRSFNIGVVRNIEIIPQAARLQALSTSEIWSVLSDCRNLANSLFEFDSISNDIDRMERLSERITKEADDIKKLSALSIYPILIKGLHYVFLDVACDTAINALQYCNKSIKVMKENQENNTSVDF